ncbi:MAG: oligosaccharide flippase family protein [Acidobacteriota bacterium]
MNILRPQQSEGILAARNAVTLGSSLALTAGMSLVIRLLIPRYLGPGPFGELRLAESFAEMLCVVLTLGVDMQLRLEAAVDPTMARRYLSGLTALRLGLGAVAIVGTVFLLKGMGTSDRAQLLFVVLALSQVLLVLNNSYAALEHASGHVTWLARTNFGAKVIWAVATIAVLVQLTSGLAIAATALSVEALRFVWFTARAVRHHRLATRPDLRLALGAVVVSLPFFVNGVAHTLYARIGTGWIAAACGDVEVGLYSAASGLASLAMFGMPLLAWVLVPSTARAAMQSNQERDELVTGALRLSLLAGVPVAAAFYFGAPLFLQWLVGPAYLPAAPVLRILAPTVGLAYVSSVCAIALIQRGRTWTVAGISLTGIAVTALLDLVLISWGSRTFGLSGGAQGAAWATLVTEVLVTAVMATLNRSCLSDGRLWRTVIALTGGVAASAVTVRFAPLVGLGPVVAAGAAFAAAFVLTGGVTRDDVAFCRRVFSRSLQTPTGVLVPEAS